MNKLRICCLQHVSFEGPGYISQWANENGYDLHIIHLYRNESLPAVDETDFLVVLGGPMNVDDEHINAYLKEEKVFIRACIDAGKTVLGLCLGSQLIIRAMNMPVFPNGEKEIGWLPVMKNKDVTHPVADLLPETVTAFHWHGDTFNLPEGALLLASSEGCVNQAYLLNAKVLGLQFHPEATPELVHNMLQHENAELVNGKPYIQTKDAIETGMPHCAEGNTVMHHLLHYLVAQTVKNNKQ